MEKTFEQQMKELAEWAIAQTSSHRLSSSLSTRLHYMNVRQEYLGDRVREPLSDDTLMILRMELMDVINTKEKRVRVADFRRGQDQRYLDGLQQARDKAAGVVVDMNPRMRERSQEIHRLIFEYEIDNGVTPLRRELFKETGYSMSVIDRHLRHMEEIGWITIKRNAHRGIALVKEADAIQAEPQEYYGLSGDYRI